MALANYSDLCTAVAAGLNRTDLTSKIPDFVLLAEGEMNRALRCRQMRQRDTATISAQFEAVPTDFAGPISMRLTSGSERALEWVSPSALYDLASWWDATPGEPEKYSVVGSSFAFSPDPDSSDYDVELIYHAKIPALVTNTTNWLLSLYPDVYYHGCMAQGWLYLLDETRAAINQAAFQRAVDDVNRASLLQEQGAYLHVGSPFAP